MIFVRGSLHPETGYGAMESNQGNHTEIETDKGNLLQLIYYYVFETIIRVEEGKFGAVGITVHGSYYIYCLISVLFREKFNYKLLYEISKVWLKRV